MHRFKDRVVLITGAASGIGRAMARRSAAEGATVIVADIDETGAANTVRVIEDDRGEAMAVRVNVTDAASVESAIAEVSARCKMNGQQLEIPWLEDRFWTPFRGRSARGLAATLRHVRGKAINIDEFIPVTEVDQLSHEEHMQLEMDRITRCVAHLKDLVREAIGCRGV